MELPCCFALLHRLLVQHSVLASVRVVNTLLRQFQMNQASPLDSHLVPNIDDFESVFVTYHSCFCLNAINAFDLQYNLES